jgi:hypothetical protein
MDGCVGLPEEEGAGGAQPSSVGVMRGGERDEEERRKWSWHVGFTSMCHLH